MAKPTKQPVRAGSKSGSRPHSRPQSKSAPTPPRDLVEFHLRWPEFRTLAVAAGEHAGLGAAEREVIRWLIRLADRVGPRDLI